MAWIFTSITSDTTASPGIRPRENSISRGWEMFTRALPLPEPVSPLL